MKVHIKSIDDNKVIIGGYAVRFSDALDRDLDNEYFTRETDFWLDKLPGPKPVMYEHGQHKKVKYTVLGRTIKFVLDDEGLDLEAELDRHAEYVETVIKLAEQGKLGWSSGAVSHLVNVREGHIKSWPIAEMTLTVAPSEPRTLGAGPIKSLYSDAGLDMPKAFLEAEKVKKNAEQSEGNDIEKTMKGLSIMDKEELNLEALVEAKIVEREEAKAEKLLEDEKRETELREKIKAALVEEIGEDVFAAKKAPALAKLSDPLKGDHTGKKAYLRWMATGEVMPELEALRPDSSWDTHKSAGGDLAGKALQEGTGSEGGFLVPDDFLADIIEKRDEQSWPRAAGVMTIQTQRDVINLPAEDTSFSAFSITAEEGSYSTNDPSFAQNQTTVYKFTKLTKLSEELLADDAAGVESFISQRVGDAWALTESQYCAIGTGSGQPEGVFEGGTTNGLTFDSSGNITGDEIPELLYKLKWGYRRNAIWLMDPQTEGYIRKIRDANDFVFPMENVPLGLASAPPASVSRLIGFPVFNDDNIPVIATGVCVIMVGDPNYYVLVERQGLRMRRNPYLYMANGQVGFFWDVRFGGRVSVAEAWQGGIMA
jgi:HK97 family phage major capsid protein